MLFNKVDNFNIDFNKKLIVENDVYIKSEILKLGFNNLCKIIFLLEKKDKNKIIKSFSSRAEIYCSFLFWELKKNNKEFLNIRVDNKNIVVNNGNLFEWIIYFYIFKNDHYFLFFKNLKKINFNNPLKDNKIIVNGLEFVDYKKLFKDFDDYKNFLFLKKNKIKYIASIKEVMVLFFILNFLKELLENKKFAEDMEYFYKRLQKIHQIVTESLKDVLNYTLYKKIESNYKEIETDIDKTDYIKLLTLILDLLDYALSIKNRVGLKKLNKNSISKLTMKLLKEKKIDFSVLENDSKIIKDYLDSLNDIKFI